MKDFVMDLIHKIFNLKKEIIPKNLSYLCNYFSRKKRLHVTRKPFGENNCISYLCLHI